MHWSCLKAVSMPTFVKGGLRGSTAVYVTLVPQHTLLIELPHLLDKLVECEAKLTRYSGVAIAVTGQAEVSVRLTDITKYQPTHKLPLIVVPGSGQTLLGRSWLNRVKVNWHSIFNVGDASQNFCGNVELRVEELPQPHKSVFEEGLGTYTGPRVNIRVQHEAMPKYSKVRPVP